MLIDIVNRIEERLSVVQLSASAASEKSGLSKDAIRNLQRAVKNNRNAGVSTNTINALAIVLETTPEWLLSGNNNNDPIVLDEPIINLHGSSAAQNIDENIDKYSNATIKGKLTGHSERIPVFGHAVAGVDGEFLMNGNKMYEALAPPGLAISKGSYAVVVSGDSMIPRFEDGEIVYVDPTYRVRRGDYVVAQIATETPDDESKLAFVKRFVKHDSGTLVLEQFNPPKELVFKHDSVVSVDYIALSGTTR